MEIRRTFYVRREKHIFCAPEEAIAMFSRAARRVSDLDSS
ncbi:MAG: hypothetical protein OJF52_002893 [Nitrospira sp.]|nr:MAG: hypothetical protein OJF52_002893 [Nitrospira sp.]